MEYNLINSILMKAEKNVGKKKLDAIKKRIETNPDYVLEEVASELKLQAFDAVQIIKFVRQEIINLPTSVLFEESFLIKEIKNRFNLKDTEENVLGSEESANRYIDKIKFMVDVARTWVKAGAVKSNKMTEYAIGFFMEKYIALLNIVRSIFAKLVDVALNMISIIISIIFGYLPKGFGYMVVNNV